MADALAKVFKVIEHVKEGAVETVFRLNGRGLSVNEDASPSCDYISVEAMTRDEDGGNCAVLVRFKTQGGATKTLSIPKEHLLTGCKAEQLLASYGFVIHAQVSQSGGSIVRRYIKGVSEQEPGIRTIVNRYIGGFTPDFKTFLHDSSGKAVSLVPDNECTYVLANDADCAPIVQSGTLTDWQDNIAKYAIFSRRLALGLMVAFSAPLLEVLGKRGAIFHFHGASSTGKTSILCAGQSIYGNRSILSWNTTINALLANAVKHNNQVMCIDELRNLKGGAGEVAYYLGNGTDRDRLMPNKNGEYKPVKKREWHTQYLSSGEINLQEAKDGVVHNGEMVRFIQIPVDQQGIFEDLPNGETAKDILNKLKSYQGAGNPAVAFIKHLEEYIAQKGVETVRNEFEEYAKRLQERIGGLDSQSGRVLEHFAIASYAGRLAIRWGIMGSEFPEYFAEDVAEDMLNLWLKAESPEERKADAKEDFFSALTASDRSATHWYKDSFNKWQSSQQTGVKAEFFVVHNDKYESQPLVYLLTKSQLRKLCKDHSLAVMPKDLLNALQNGGLLITNGNRQDEFLFSKRAFGMKKGTHLVILIADESDKETADKFAKLFSEYV